MYKTWRACAVRAEVRWPVYIPVRWILAFVVCCAVHPELLLAQSNCDRLLARAEESYRQDNPDESIDLVSQCLSETNAPDQTKVSAYRLLTLAYLRKEDLNEAKLALIQLLSIDPGFTPDPVQDPPAFTALVNLTKQQVLAGAQPLPVERPPEPEVRRRSWFARTGKWLLLSSGLAAAGLTTALLLTTGGNEPTGPTGPTPLPEPPAMP